jgi:type VI secretion system protein ImpA
VEELAAEALTGRTKDLQVAAWLAEARAFRCGFTGIRDGLRLVAGLLDMFWETLHPEIDDDGDLTARANIISALDRQLALALRSAPVTAGSGMALGWLKWQESRPFDVAEGAGTADPEAQARLAELKQKAVADGKMSGEDYRRAKGATRRAFYEETWKTLQEGMGAFGDLDREMDERFKAQTPGLGELKKAFEDVRSLVERILKEKRAMEPDPAAAAAAPVDRPSSAAGDESPSGERTLARPGAVRGRQEALARLSEVAEFFRRTEPHSPVSYLVDRAVAWGGMPLESWLAEVVKDPATLEQIKETLGIRRES